MSQIKVKDLATTIKIPVERLLTQLQDAGAMVATPEDLISDEQKMQLLQHLKGGHSGSDGAAEPKKITLKRKKTSELTTLSTADTGRSSRAVKKVKVEVRKKRTYVKPSDVVEEAIAEPAVVEPVESTDNVAAVVVAESVVDVAPVVESAPEVAAETVSTEPTSEVKLATTTEKPAARKEEATTAEKKFSKPSDGKRVEEESERDKDKKSTKRDVEDRKTKKIARSRLSVNTLLSDDEEGFDGLDSGRRRRRSKSRHPKADANLIQHSFEKPTEPVMLQIEIPESIQASDLAHKLGIKAPELIKVLMKMGVMVTINQLLDQDTAVLVVEELGHQAIASNVNALEDSLQLGDAHYSNFCTRPPVVTVMGHVDHGKTSLLDFIRRTKVTVGEAGGITQHIGAYHVETERGVVTFLDTPGHEAFTAMRARGAQVTDLVILIVAADDGVMPQTVEAVQHAKAAKVPIIVAVNKMDKPDADPDRVKTELTKYEVVAEEWGGDVMFINISAKTGEGVDRLLESVLVQAEMLELTAPTEGPARGVVIEARVDKGRGPVITVLVQRGTLNKGDILLAGTAVGRVRAIQDENGRIVHSAGPSMPVEILGFSSLPAAGDDAAVVSDEKQAREIAEHRSSKQRDLKFSKQRLNKMDSLFQDMGSNLRVLPVLLKTDVQGSLEAITDALEKLATDEVKLKIIASGIGAITESDVNLARASGAMILGFNVRVDAKGRVIVEREGIPLHYYSVIYDLIKDMERALSSMLSPERHEKIVGLAEVRDVFRSPKFGAIAGCMVLEGVVKRHFPIRVLRNSVVIYEGELESLRRFKDDVNEVKHGMECGIGVKNYNDVQPKDQIEVYEIVEISRTIGSSSKQEQNA